MSVANGLSWIALLRASPTRLGASSGFRISSARGSNVFGSGGVWLNGMRNSAEHAGQLVLSPPYAFSHCMCWPQDGHVNFNSLITALSENGFSVLRSGLPG